MDGLTVTTPACPLKTNKDKRAYSPCDVVSFLNFGSGQRGKGAETFRGGRRAPYGYGHVYNILDLDAVATFVLWLLHPEKELYYFFQTLYEAWKR